MVKRSGFLVTLTIVLCLFVSMFVLTSCGKNEPPPPPQSSSQGSGAPTAPAPQPTPARAPPPAAAPQPGVQAPMGGYGSSAPMQGSQNYGQVQMGMTTQQVQDLLGPPGKVEQKSYGVEWEYFGPQGKFEVKFQNDRVISMGRH